MAELKTAKTGASVSTFLAAIADPARRKECRAVARMMKEATGTSPRMWGDTIVGFGDMRCKYASGREVDWFLAGFSPRRQSLSLYLMPNLDAHAALLKKLGKHSTGKSCLYIKRLEDVDQAVLKRLINEGVKAARRYSAR